MIAISTIIRSAVRRAVGYCRVQVLDAAPAPVPAEDLVGAEGPACTPETEPVSLDQSIFALEQSLGLTGETPEAHNDATAPVTAQIPRLICQDPQPGSMQWWATHRWIWFESVFMCSRCERLWPQVREELDDE